MVKRLCDTTLPPLCEFAIDHVIACHLEKATLLAMEPVMTIDALAPLPDAGT